LPEETSPELEASRLGVEDGSLILGPMSFEATWGKIVMLALINREDELGRIISQELDEDVVFAASDVDLRVVWGSERDEEEKRAVGDRGLSVVCSVLDIALVASISDVSSDMGVL